MVLVHYKKTQISTAFNRKRTLSMHNHKMRGFYHCGSPILQAVLAAAVKTFALPAS